jgi:hypothetical protein
MEKSKLKTEGNISNINKRTENILTQFCIQNIHRLAVKLTAHSLNVIVRNIVSEHSVALVDHLIQCRSIYTMATTGQVTEISSMEYILLQKQSTRKKSTGHITNNFQSFETYLKC